MDNLKYLFFNMNCESTILTGFLLLTTLPLSAQLPNIVFVLTDDMGCGDISKLNSSSPIRTPHLDALVDQGITFSDAHSNSSVSTPTRYGILTGCYAFRSTLKRGVLNGMSEPLIPPSRATLATLLSAKGYATACIGKWHLGLGWSRNAKNEIDYALPIVSGPNQLGFDYFYGLSASLDMPPYAYIENDRVTQGPLVEIPAGKGKIFHRAGIGVKNFNFGEALPHLTGKAIKYIESRRRTTQPFFLYFSLTGPHTPIVPTLEYQGRTGAPYTDFVVMIDELVGRLVTSLRDNGLWENTIIVFTSDNGCSPSADFTQLSALGHHPNGIYRGAKADLYDGGHRIPLVVTWGDRYRSIRDSSLICLTDFFATFADITDYAIGKYEGEDSFSFYPLLLGKTGGIRKTVVHHSVDGSFAIRSSRWKLLTVPSSGGWSYPHPKKDAEIISKMPQIQLYDMENDPSETTNVSERYPLVVKDLLRELEKIKADGRSDLENIGR